MKHFCIIYLGAFLFALPISARANSALQTPDANASGCTSDEFHAAHLEGKDMHFNVLLPRDYSTDTDRRFPVLYLLHGFDGDYSDWCKNTKLIDYAAPYEEIIVMPDGGNGWYINSYSDPKLQWENYIIDDLVSYVDSHFRTIASRHGRAIAGLSMGGYGSLFLGLKHHDMFAAVASLSGVVAAANLKRWDMQLRNANIRSHSQFFIDVRNTMRADFGPEDNPGRTNQDPFLLIRNLTPANCPQLYLAIGWDDSLLYENREFVALLSTLKMPYRYVEVPGKHEWKVWDEQIQRVLALQAPILATLPPASTNTN